jgi:hypothetical protein
MANAPAGVTVTVAVAWELVLARLVAVTTTEVLLVTLGAVNAPLLEMVPALADQVTAVLAVPLICAVNCCCPCEVRVMLLGEIEMVLLDLLAETTISAELEPDIGPGRLEMSATDIAPVFTAGRVETDSVKL